jgi:hypothetical protein
MNDSSYLLRIVATNLPKHSIRPLIPITQSLQNFFQQKTHLENSQKTTLTLIFSNLMEEKTAFTNRKIKRVRVKVVDYAFFKQDFFFWIPNPNYHGMTLFLLVVFLILHFSFCLDSS